jgi:hypothetical protein
MFWAMTAASVAAKNARSSSVAPVMREKSATKTRFSGALAAKSCTPVEPRRSPRTASASACAAASYR